MTRPILQTTTALVMAAGLALPVHAQGLADLTPREIMDRAVDGKLNLGFKTEGMSRIEIREQLFRLKRRCASDDKPENVNCQRISQLPDSLAMAPSDGDAMAALNENPAQQTQAPETPKAQANEAPANEAPAANRAGSEPSRRDENADVRERAQEILGANRPGVADPAPQRPRAAEPDRQAPARAEPERQSAQDQANALAEEERRTKAAAAAATQDSSDKEPEVVREAVEADDVRRSDQDFRTRIGAGQSAARAQANAESDDDDDDDGLSNAQKTALFGLGAIALANILGDNANVVENTGDRVVVEENGQYRVLRNDDVLLRRPGSDVTTYRYDDGSTRSVLEYEDGSVVETIKAADGRVLRRTRTSPEGETVVLFDDTQSQQEVVISDLPQVSDTPERVAVDEVSEEDLAAALAAQRAEGIDRRFSLNQIRNIDAVRHLVPEISVDSINFETGSASIRPEEARALARLGNAMKRMIAERPGEVFLVEGHTDAVGAWSYNLALSDRRAESVALALTEHFGVPPENMVLQGYGESDLAVDTQLAERGNRRAGVRRITRLLQGG